MASFSSIVRPELRLRDHGTVAAGVLTIAPAEGNAHHAVIAGDQLIALGDPPRAGFLEIALTQDAAGGHAIDWPTELRWPDGGTQPAISGAPGVLHHFRLMWLDGEWWVVSYNLNLRRPGDPPALVGFTADAGDNNPNGTFSYTPSLPPATVVGDLILVAIANGNNTQVAAPAGWTRIINRNYFSGAGDDWLAVFERVHDGSALSAFTLGSQVWAVITTTWTGINSADPIDPVGTPSDHSKTGASIVAGAGDRIVAIVGHHDTPASFPAGWTVIDTQGWGAANLLVGYATAPAAGGATGALTVTAPNTNTTVVQLALQTPGGG